MNPNRSKFIVVLSSTILLFGIYQTAIADPPEKPGNPGVPGLLAEIAELKAQIADLEAIIQSYQDFAPVSQTGQTASYGTGDDGGLQIGMPLPKPRFIDNQDGTVTDNLTKLVWLQDSYRFGRPTWQGALDACNSLAADGGALCDGSVEGDWRLPNVRELFSLNHYGFFWPAMSNTQGTGPWSEGDPFVNMQSDLYCWSSTTNPQPQGRELAIWVNLG